MQKKKPNFLSTLMTAALIALAFQMLLGKTLKQGAQAAQPTQAELVREAFQLEAAAYPPDQQLSVKDKRDKLNAAIKAFEKAYNRDKKTVIGARARFEEVRILQEMAEKNTGTGEYNRAERLLKGMEGAFVGREVKPALKAADALPWKATANYRGDLGALASIELNGIRKLRDERQSHSILYRIMDWSVAATGRNPNYSYALALIVITVVLKLLLFPFTKQQYKHQREMAKLQPQLKKMQEEMKGQPQQKIQQRTMALYKENNVNMLGGCLPMIMQMAVLIPIYRAVRVYEYQFIQGKMLWIGSQFAQAHWWVANNLAQFDVPMYALYLVSMVAYSLVMPKPPNPDPSQAKTQKLMTMGTPLIFGVMMWFWKLSAAFMFYWLIMNLVSFYQTWQVNRHLDDEGKSGKSEAAKEPAGPVQPMQGVQQPKDTQAKKSRRPASPLTPPPRSSRKKSRRKGIARG